MGPDLVRAGNENRRSLAKHPHPPPPPPPPCGWRPPTHPHLALRPRHFETRVLAHAANKLPPRKKRATPPLTHVNSREAHGGRRDCSGKRTSRATLLEYPGSAQTSPTGSELGIRGTGSRRWYWRLVTCGGYRQTRNNCRYAQPSRGSLPRREIAQAGGDAPPATLVSPRGRRAGRLCCCGGVL